MFFWSEAEERGAEADVIVSFLFMLEKLLGAIRQH
jgi:hypothetical protein